MDIKVDFNFLPFTKALKAAYKEQIPFALSKAINKTAFQVREATFDHLRSVFTIRRPYVLFGAAGRGGIRVNTSDKKHLVAEIGTEDEFMVKQAVGGAFSLPSGKRQAIPLGIRKTPSTNVTKAQWPGQLIGKKVKGHKGKAFLVRFKSGFTGLAARKTKARFPITALYKFQKTTHFKKEFRLEDILQNTMKRNWEKNAIEALDKALATSKR